jgi:hypothetical protein
MVRPNNTVAALQYERNIYVARSILGPISESIPSIPFLTGITAISNYQRSRSRQWRAQDQTTCIPDTRENRRGHSPSAIFILFAKVDWYVLKSARPGNTYTGHSWESEHWTGGQPPSAIFILFVKGDWYACEVQQKLTVGRAWGGCPYCIVVNAHRCWWVLRGGEDWFCWRRIPTEWYRMF